METKIYKNHEKGGVDVQILGRRFFIDDPEIRYFGFERAIERRINISYLTKKESILIQVEFLR